MKILTNIWHFFFPKMVDGKQLIEDEMAAKYGDDWMEQMFSWYSQPIGKTSITNIMTKYERRNN